MKNLPGPEVLNLLSYDPKSGSFSKLGLPMPRYMDSRGYLRSHLSGAKVPLHRLAFKLMTGDWPDTLIDHINRDKTDNRWINLRKANKTQSNWNRKLPISSLGYIGVGYSRTGLRFRACIKHNEERRSIGTFGCPTAAAIAYDREAIRLRGEFAVLNFPQSNAGVGR